MSSQRNHARICLEPGSSPHVFDLDSEPLEFVRESLRKRGAIIADEGIRGTRSAASERTRAGEEKFRGEIVLHPSPADLDRLLPRILGAAESAGLFEPAELLPAFGVLVDRAPETFEYADCCVNRAVFRGRRNEPIELALELVAMSEATGTAYPAVTPGASLIDAPYVFSDGAVMLAGQTRQMRSFELVIDNHLAVRRVNSLAPTSIVPQSRTVTLKTTHPFSGDDFDLYGQPPAGAAGSLTLANGNLSTTFTFASLQVPALSPAADGAGEIELSLEMTARSVSVTKELVVTNDSTW